MNDDDARKPRSTKRMRLNLDPLKLTKTTPGALRCVACKRNHRNCRCGPTTYEILGEDGEWR